MLLVSRLVINDHCGGIPYETDGLVESFPGLNKDYSIVITYWLFESAKNCTYLHR